MLADYWFRFFISHRLYRNRVSLWFTKTFCVSNLKIFLWTQRWSNTTFYVPAYHTVSLYSYLITKVMPRLKTFVQVKSTVLKNKVNTTNANLSKTGRNYFALYRRNSERINACMRLKIVKF